jgi:hypothetical protein
VVRAFTTLEIKRGANALLTPFSPSVVLKLHLVHEVVQIPNKKHPGILSSVYLPVIALNNMLTTKRNDQRNNQP